MVLFARADSITFFGSSPAMTAQEIDLITIAPVIAISLSHILHLRTNCYPKRNCDIFTVELFRILTDKQRIAHNDFYNDRKVNVDWSRLDYDEQALRKNLATG